MYSNTNNFGMSKYGEDNNEGEMHHPENKNNYSVHIHDVEEYIKEIMRQLNDTNHCKELPNDPTKLHRKLVNRTIESFKRRGTQSETSGRIEGK